MLSYQGLPLEEEFSPQMRHKVAFKRKKKSAVGEREISRRAFYPSDKGCFAYTLGEENLANWVVV